MPGASQGLVVPAGPEHHSMRQRFSEMMHHIHLSPGHKLLTDEKVLKSSLAALALLVRSAAAEGLFVLLDMHRIGGRLEVRQTLD